MKKILVVALTVVAFATSAFGSEAEKYTAIYKFNETKELKSLANFISADSDQKSQLALIFNLTEKKLKGAIESNDAEAIEDALNFNIGNAKVVLDSAQYKKYLVYLNLAVNNELDKYIASL